VSAGGTARRVRGIVLAFTLLAAIAAIVHWVARPVPEISEGLDPDPIAPYGAAIPAEIVFRWALPADGVPVRVEVLDANASEPPLWTSSAVAGGSLRPPSSAVGTWPRGNLYWRPVAIARDGSPRPGPLAAFMLPP